MTSPTMAAVLFGSDLSEAWDPAGSQASRLLRLARPPARRPRPDVAAMIERHAALAVEWFQVLIDAHLDPTATEPELTRLCETACDALDARIAALRADLWTADR